MPWAAASLCKRSAAETPTYSMTTPCIVKSATAAPPREGAATAGAVFFSFSFCRRFSFFVGLRCAAAGSLIAAKGAPLATRNSELQKKGPLYVLRHANLTEEP